MTEFPEIDVYGEVVLCKEDTVPVPQQRKIVPRNKAALDYYEEHVGASHDEYCNIHFGGKCDCHEV